MCILGICAMAMPFRVFLGIGWAVGALLVVYGIMVAYGSLTGVKKNGWACALGVLIAISGLAILFNAVSRMFADIMIAYILAFNIVAYGILQFVGAHHAFKAEDKKHGWLSILFGVVMLICGILAIVHPLVTMISIGYIIAIMLIAEGVSVIMDAFKAPTFQQG